MPNGWLSLTEGEIEGKCLPGRQRTAWIDDLRWLTTDCHANSPWWVVTDADIKNKTKNIVQVIMRCIRSFLSVLLWWIINLQGPVSNISILSNIVLICTQCHGCKADSHEHHKRNKLFLSWRITFARWPIRNLTYVLCFSTGRSRVVSSNGSVWGLCDTVYAQVGEMLRVSMLSIFFDVFHI